MSVMWNKVTCKVYYAMSNMLNWVRIRLNHVKSAKDVRIYGPLRISNAEGGTIEIGRKSIVNSSWYSNKSGGGQNRTSLITEGTGKIIIGNNCGISNSTIYSKVSIVMEDNVMIGVNCVIYDTDFHSVDVQNRLNGNRNVKTKPVVIKNGAWIGGHCTILKGVTIGRNSVIGAGSVVTHDVPDSEVWAGNPARFLKRI